MRIRVPPFAMTVTSIVFLLLMAPGFTLASPITFDFIGSVTFYSFNSSDPNNNSIAPGTSFSGTFTFDSLAVEQNAGACNINSTCTDLIASKIGRILL